VKITVVSVGKKISKAVLETALAAGADELVKVEDDAFASNALDSFACASILACAIRNMGGFDLILAGRQAADWNAGQVGVGVAHLLDLTVVTLARKVEMHGGCAIVERLTSAGETVRAPLPAVVVVSNEVGMMRYPTIVQRREAKKKPVVSWGAGDIGLGLPLENRLLLRKLFAPAMRQRDCVFVEGESAAEAGRKLAQRLLSDGIF
jgi:electron transfer flavoprotein beta subunit